MLSKLFFLFPPLLFITPLFYADAASVFFDPLPGTYKVGGNFTLSLILDAEGQSINAIDIEVLVPELLRIKSISKSGSVIQLWVSEPSFSDKTITLTGGIPGGTTASRGTIAKISLEAAAVGEGNIAFMPGSSVLLNDGQGTKLDLRTTGGPMFSVIPRPKESEPVPSPAPSTLETPKETPVPTPEAEVKVGEKQDKKKPEKFEILFGKDPRVFDGEDFISFFTIDSDSGVERYEVKFGKEPFKVAQPPYLIKDILPGTVIKIRAYDAAGNYRESVYPGILKRVWWKLITPLRFLLYFV